jgi:pyruvate dehydrogenase E2 component (dihydrolipoyllysine-residue acetyltransferase)
MTKESPKAMSVSVSMPQLGESVTEGTVTRWLKKEGERVEADEPLLEVSTDKVDTEIPSPVSGILRGITVAEDETVAVGAELAVIDETDGAAPAAEAAPAQAPPAEAPPAEAPPAEAPPAEAPPAQAPAAEAAPEYPPAPAAPEYAPPAPPEAGPGYEPAGQQAPYAPPPMFTPGPAAPSAAPPAEQAPPPAPAAEQIPPAAPAEEAPPATAAAEQEAPPPPPAAAEQAPPPLAVPAAEQAPSAPPEADGSRPADAAPPAAAAQAPPAPPPAAPAPPPPPAPAAEPAAAAPAATVLPSAADGPYVTPLVRKLAAEHGVDLAAVTGTGVGGRIRKQDVLEAARAAREAAPAAAPAAAAATAPVTAPADTTPAASAPAATAAAPAAPAAAPARAIVPSTVRGTTERMSRARQLIARRMVESLQTSAQLTTVVEADVTLISRLRDRAKADFEAREGVKLSFLPFFALATVEALKIHPKLNAVIDTEAGQVTYHDAEHLGIAVDTERGLMVPVIQNAGDLNIGGLARKIADLAARTRAGQVSPDDLAGGTFTLTNTGSRGALFDTPIINQPQVAILGTGSVVKRPVVVEDPALGEVITVRSMAYLALTYDHRLVDGADAARFLATVKDRLEEGEFEAELGL